MNLLSNEANNSGNAPNGTGSQNDQAGTGQEKGTVASGAGSGKQPVNLRAMRKMLHEEFEGIEIVRNEKERQKKAKFAKKSESMESGSESKEQHKKTGKKKYVKIISQKPKKKSVKNILQKPQKKSEKNVPEQPQKKLDMIRESDEDLFEDENGSRINNEIKIKDEKAEQQQDENRQAYLEYLRKRINNHPAKNKAINAINNIQNGDSEQSDGNKINPEPGKDPVIKEEKGSEITNEKQDDIKIGPEISVEEPKYIIDEEDLKSEGGMKEDLISLSSQDRDIDLLNKNSNSGQKEKIIEGSEDGSGSLIKDDELINVEQDQAPVQNWNFTPQRMEDVRGISGFSKFKNKLASIFSNVFGFIFSGFGLKQWIAKKRRSSAAEKKANLGDNIQKRRDHSVIPGWEGQKYDPDANSGEDILADFRRVPTVWSRIIADKASEGEGENERPLPPTISFYIDQPKDHSEQHMRGLDIGHSMIGIEYSRFSHVTNRYERYRMKYGFYPAFAGGMSGTISMAEYGAMLPGQLQNDASHDYTVSRRYPATAKQVNSIIEASQTYADGGYGYYARNCTTFVRDMANVAHLPVSDNLFEMEDVAFSDLANFGVVGAGIPGKNSLAGIEEKFVSLSQDEDKSYANLGNKRVTEADFENYRQSIGDESGASKRTYIPGSVGEKLRRETTGEIGSQSYRGKVKKDDDVKKIRTEINRHGNELNELLMRELLAEAGRSNNDNLPWELIDMVRPLPRSGEVLLPIEAAHDRGKPCRSIRSDLPVSRCRRISKS